MDTYNQEFNQEYDPNHWADQNDCCTFCASFDHENGKCPATTKCDLCHKIATKGNFTATGGNTKTGVEYYTCNNCCNTSEANYQASNMDVDRREAEIAELDY